MSGTVVAEALHQMRAAVDTLAAADFDSLSRADLVAALDEYEALGCALPSVGHRMLARLQVETTAVEMGAKNWKQVLATRWRITTAEAGRRLDAAKELGPRQQITGPPLPPVLPAVAAAQGAGLINTEHVAILRKTMHKLPHWVDAVTRAQFEVDLVRLAVTKGPDELDKEAAQRLFLLDQDGPEPDDTERQRRRGVSVGKQGHDGMSKVSGAWTPEMRATWEAIFAKFAAPGMCNPADSEPCVTGTPSQAQIDNDTRSVSQRQHDAMLIIGRIALSTDLGQVNGLPVQIIVRTTLQDLESRAGIGTTGGGSMLPIADVIRMGAHAHWALAIFDGAAGSALELLRTKRIASPAQRLMLIAREGGGCTKPGCPVGAYGCQVHHAVTDWAEGGNTNVDELALACPADNRLVGPAPHQWTTDVINGETHWIPPEGLETGQARVNHLHRPEHLTIGDDTALLPWEKPARKGPKGPKGPEGSEPPEPQPHNTSPPPEPKPQPPPDADPWSFLDDTGT